MRLPTVGVVGLWPRLKMPARAAPPVNSPTDSTATASEFSATPQAPPLRQPRLQMEPAVSLARNSAGANSPASSRTAETSTHTIGYSTNSSSDPPISSSDPVTKLCPVP